MRRKKLTEVGYEQGLEDMHNYVRKMITNAINNPDVSNLPPRMVLQILLASLDLDDLRNA